MSWYTEPGSQSDVVICSRVRMARNLSDYAFPHKMSHDEARSMLDFCRDSRDDVLRSGFDWLDVRQMSKENLGMLMEQRFISPKLFSDGEKSAVMLSKDETVQIMFNEEDHLRIQSLAPGFDLEKAYRLVNSIDDRLSQSMEYAFSPKLGYITACPTNIGTGVRASVMLHLPALSGTGKINEFVSAVTRLGIEIRGMYGEGSSIAGNVYQISNQITLGMDEEEIIRKFSSIACKIIEQERTLQNNIYASSGVKLQDKIMRSYGTLKYARLLTNSELLVLLSDIRLGVSCGVLDIDPVTINKISVLALPAHIASMFDGEPSQQDIDERRASFVQEFI